MSTGKVTGVTSNVTGLPSTRPVRQKSSLVESKITTKKSVVTSTKTSIAGGKNNEDITGILYIPLIYPLFTIPTVLKNEKEITNLKTLLENLPRKSQKEISDFLLLQLLPKQKDSEREVNIWITSVLFHLKKVLPDISTHIAPANPVRKIASKSYYDVSQFILSTGMPNMNLIRTSALLNLLAGLLVKHCHGVSRKMNFPLSMKFVFQSSHLVSGIFDSAYPSYIQSGLMSVVIDKLTASKSKEEK